MVIKEREARGSSEVRKEEIWQMRKDMKDIGDEMRQLREVGGTHRDDSTQRGGKEDEGRKKRAQNR